MPRRIFEMFQWLNTGEKFEGTGESVFSIAKKRLDMRGNITIESALIEEVVSIVELPLAPKHEGIAEPAAD